jgi:hypothetical protein
LDSVEVKIDLCGLDSCHDEDEDDDESDGSTQEVVHKVQCSQQSSSQDKNSRSSHSHQNNTNNMTGKQFSQKKEVDLDRQVQSGSDLKFKRIPPKRSQSDEQGKQHIKQQHNLAVQIKSPPMSRKSVQKPRDFDERACTSVEGGEVHVENSTKRRARASMTSNANGLKDEAENNGNSGATFFQSVLRCGAPSTAAVPHNLMKPVKAITRYTEMPRSPAGAAESILFGDNFLHQHANVLQAEDDNNGDSGAAFFQSAITRDKEMKRSPAGAAETVLLGDHSLQQHANGAPHNLMKRVEAITRDKAMTRSPSGHAETVLVGDHLLQQVSDLSWQADPLGGSVSSSESSRLYREEVHQMSLRRIVPVRTKDLAEYVRKLDDKTIDARRAQLRQTIEHCQSKLLGVNP